MSRTLGRVQQFLAEGQVRVSDHGYDELAADAILAGEVIAGAPQAVVLEDYPGYIKGPCVLVLQHDSADKAIHAVWGIAQGTTKPAVLITAYRPDPEKWTQDFKRRKP